MSDILLNNKVAVHRAFTTLTAIQAGQLNS